MRWVTNLDGGPRRVNHAAAVVGDRIYSFGGYCTGEGYKVRRPIDVHILNTVSLRWDVLRQPKDEKIQYKLVPFQRYGHTANAYDHLIFVWGGRNDRGACNRIFCFNTQTRCWELIKAQGNPPGARDGHTSCVIDHQMYIFGGYEEIVNQFSQDIFSFHLKMYSWTHIKAGGIPPNGRDFHSASTIGRYMYIFGGRSGRYHMFYKDDEIYCNEIVTFDTQTKTWSPCKVYGAKPVGRRSHSAFVYRDQLYIFGGFNGTLNRHYSDIFKLNFDTLQWSRARIKGKPPVARRRQCCCVVGQRLYLFGGTSPVPQEYETDESSDDVEPQLIDHNDLFVLDFSPTLKTLCQMAVIKFRLSRECLPFDLQKELELMTTNNSIS